MCREEALEIKQRRADIEAAGVKRVVCLLKENIPEEVAAFQSGYWDGEIFLDETKAFYLALGGGAEHKPVSGVAAFLAMLANPFNKNPFKANQARVKAKKIENNMTGEGFIAGGVYVVKADGTHELAALEANLGDHTSIEDICAAAQRASK